MKDQKKTVLILNPAAGKGKGKKHISHIIELLKEKISDLEYKVSEHPGHSSILANEAVSNGFERIISVGGDGTPFEIINGILEGDDNKKLPEFGFIPAGTGNSFLRDFMDISVDEAVSRIAKFKPVKIDLPGFTYFENGKKIKKSFHNILGVGLIADILELTNRRLKKFGSSGYGIAVLIRLFRGMNNDLELITDGKNHHFKNSALVVSNSKFTGGNMKIAPGADTSDGKLDVTVFNDVNRRDIIKIFKGVFSGKHIKHPKVVTTQCKKIKLNSSKKERIMADGELLGYTPLEIEINEGRLKVLL